MLWRSGAASLKEIIFFCPSILCCISNYCYFLLNVGKERGYAHTFMCIVRVVSVAFCYRGSHGMSVMSSAIGYNCWVFISKYRHLTIVQLEHIVSLWLAKIIDFRCTKSSSEG